MLAIVSNFNQNIVSLDFRPVSIVSYRTNAVVLRLGGEYMYLLTGILKLTVLYIITLIHLESS